jgi:hypothetical protein
MAIEIITVTDIRNAGHCAAGIKRWFDEHELNFRDFLKNGIDAEILIASGDELALQSVEHARAHRGRANG